MTGVIFSFFSGKEVHDNIGDNSHGDSLGDAVEERHRDDAEECRDSFCRVIEIDLRYGADHVKAYNDQGRSRRKGRDCKEDRR